MDKKVKKSFIATFDRETPLFGWGNTVTAAYEELKGRSDTYDDKIPPVEDCNFYVVLPIEVKSQIEVVHVPVWDNSES